ncbi:MAG TPA: aminoglycoside phosphotransferase, partial [Gammaproteobacteria bacterium]|nr:aminoglycoside phosphotransferase [Gammaproteobacteria bacterium]
KPACFNHPVDRIELIETHISWVILTGDFAYKIKKPVNFGFLDFSTLKKRHHYCLDELRLNRRLAPDIYLEVVTITGTTTNPVMEGKGETVDYAVKMKQFPQSAQLDNMLAADGLDARHMDAIANMIADFHQHIDIADEAVSYGDKSFVIKPVEENFTQIKLHIDTRPYASVLAELEGWNQTLFEELGDTFVQRKSDGFIRECHGDLHLRNMLWLNEHPLAFDCIEFNAELRWIDVISDLAFLVMDLQARQQHQLANHLLNRYLEITGNYPGLTVLPFYLAYRAMVRAKVSALRLEQEHINIQERELTQTAFVSYLKLAKRYTQRGKTRLIIMHGLSASGKSSVSQQLLDPIGAIRIRSDVERKRLFNTAPEDHAEDKMHSGLYSAESTRQTYARLIELARSIINAGFSVIVDATFLKQTQREPFQRLAENLNTTYLILDVIAPDDILRRRIINRKHDISDAGIAVLEHQIKNRLPLHQKEADNVITVDSTKTLDINALVDKISRITNE